MLSTVYCRTDRGQITVLTRSDLSVQQTRLLMRFTGFTPLEFLSGDMSGPDDVCQIAQQLLHAGLIEQVRAEEPLTSEWGALDELVPA